MFRAGLMHFQAGGLPEAEAWFRRLLASAPGHAEAHHLLGIVALQTGRVEAGIESLRRAVELNGQSPFYHNNLGNALQIREKFGEAISCYDATLALKPDYAEAFYNRGNVASYGLALELKPDYVEALNNRSGVLHALKRFEDALTSYGEALAIDPRDAATWYSRGNTLSELRRFGEAIISYEQALALAPDYAEALVNCGLALGKLRQFDAALTCYGKALALNPKLPEAYCNRGLALKELGRLDEAYASYGRALALRPGDPEALAGSGVTLQLLGRYSEASNRCQKALALEPDHVLAFSGLLMCANMLCGWGLKADLTRKSIEYIAKKSPAVFPLTFLRYSGNPQLQLECAKNFAAHTFHPHPKPLCTGERGRRDKLRIAYLSADFQDHATAHLMAELFERHDRSRFEVMAISFGIGDGSPMRQRLAAAFDRFYDAYRRSDEDTARFLYERRVDIAIDLKGHTQGARPGILAYCPAPVQISYLGYPRYDGGSIHRLHRCRQDRDTAGTRKLLHRENRPAAGLLPGQRPQASYC